MLIRYVVVLLLCARFGISEEIFDYDGRSHTQLENVKKKEKKARSDQKNPDPTVGGSQPVFRPVDMSYCSEWCWQRKPYETIDQWHDRIHHDLCCVRDQLFSLRDNVKKVLSKEQELAKQTSLLVVRNEKLRQAWSEWVEQAQESTVFRAVPQKPAPFHLHLVKKGQTLYGIAMDYYGSSTMVSRIVQWNQEWIRDKDQLIAGLCLVLFPQDYQGTAEREVSVYLQDILFLIE